MFRNPWLSAVIAALSVFTLSSVRSHASERDAYGDPLPENAKARIGTTRFRHGDTVTSAAFAPDGRTVATASRDGTLSLWESESGKELLRCRGHVGAVLAVTFSGDGKQLISGGADGTVRFWGIPLPPSSRLSSAGKETHCYRLSGEEVQALALSADGSTAAAGTADGLVVVWDLNNGKERQRFTQEGQVYCLALSADGKHVAANQAASGIVVRDALRGALHCRLGAGVVTSLAFSPNGRTLAAGYQNDRLLLWDTRRGVELRPLGGQERHATEIRHGVLSLGFSADGRQLASGGADNTLRVWDAESGSLTSVVTGHDDGVTTVAFAADGKRLISGGADCRMRLWDAASGRSLTPQREPTMPLTGVSLSSDGRILALIQSPDRLALWDTRTLREQRLPAALNNGQASAAAFSPLGATLAVAGADGRLRICNLTTRAVRVSERELPRRLGRLVWSRDGDSLASLEPDHAIDLWDANKAELLQHMGLQEEAYVSLVFDRQGHRLATASEADAIRLWDRATGVERQPVTGRFAGALALSFSADGRSLCTAGRDGRVRLWELFTNQPRYTFPVEGAEITAAAFTPDGRFLATGDTDGVVRLWDASAGKERHVFRGHRGPVTMLTFAARAAFLASASRDTTALVWNLNDLLHTEPPPALELSERRIEALWSDLAGAAPQAYDALQILHRASQQIVPYLRGRLRPMKIDYARLIRDLDSDEFVVRQKASEQLADYGRVAEKPLREALKNRPTLEVRRRIEELLVQIEEAPDVIRAAPREMRCIELLESIGSIEAQRVLQTLAAGIAEAELTQEAKTSLNRLTRRASLISKPLR